MLPFVVSGTRKLSLPGFTNSSKKKHQQEILIMANHRPRRMYLEEHQRAANDKAPVHPSPTQTTAGSAGSSPPSASFNLLYPLSTRFTGKTKDSSGASSSNRGSPKKSKDKKKVSRTLLPASSPGLSPAEHLISIHEVSVEVLKEWELSFNSLLKHPDGIDLFESFLKSEFSEENIQFWKACEKYKTTPDHLVVKEATLVFDEFLAPQAPKLVNIDHQTSREIVENMKKPNKYTFNKAQQSIYLLMARDSFVRFIKSDPFQRALKR